jgi:hypothetical protein
MKRKVIIIASASALVAGLSASITATLPAAAEQPASGTGQFANPKFIVEADIDTFGLDVTKLANYDEIMRSKEEFIKNYWATHPQPEATATAPSN